MKDKKNPEMIKQRKLLRKSTAIIMLGIIVFSGLTVLVVKQSPSIKDRYKAAPPITGALLQNLTAFKQTESQEYLPFGGPIAAGDKLAFTVSVLRPTFVGLLVSVNQQKPAFEFYTRLPPGKSRRIERQGERFIFTVTDVVKTLRVCAVYEVNKKALQKVYLHPELVWPGLSGSSCIAFK